jgi:hypothetical protein
MQRAICISGFFCWVAAALAGAGAQEASAPRITLSQDFWNFGEVWHPESTSLTLVVTNTGNADLQIKDVRTTCGCTLVEPGRKLIPPGENTEVMVRFNSEGKQDHVESKVIITSNDPTKPTVEMKIAGEVKRAVKRTPLGGLVIRTLDGKAGQVGSLRLENQMPDPMRLRLVRSSLQDSLDVEVKEVTPGLAYDVVARTKHDLQPGAVVRGSLEFDTGLTKERQLTVHARVQVLARIETSPPIIYLDPKTATAPSERSVSLHYYGAAEFKVLEAQSDRPDIQVRFQPPEPPTGGMERVTPKITALVRTTVSLPPASSIPPEGALIEYTTSDPEFPKVQVRVTTDSQVWRATIQGPSEGPLKPM